MNKPEGKKVELTSAASLLLIILLLVNCCPVSAADGLSEYDGAPGARAVFGGLAGTELFLGGNYIELGISNWGDFGTEGIKPDCFRGTLGGDISPGGGSNRIGMSADHDGFNRGLDLAVDYYLPGTPEERFVVGYKIGERVFSSSNSALGSSYNMPTVVQNHSDTSSGLLKATIVSVWEDIMEVSQVISFTVNDKFYRTHVTIKNLSDTTWDSARYMRTFDPDNSQFRGGSYDTANTVTHTVDEDGIAVVVAKTKGEEDPVFKATGSRIPFFFYSKDPGVRTSVFGFTNTNPYIDLAYNNPIDKGVTMKQDMAITLTWDSGTLASGESKGFVFYSSLDERDFDEVVQDIRRIEERDINCQDGPDRNGEEVEVTESINDAITLDVDESERFKYWTSQSPRYDEDTSLAFDGMKVKWPEGAEQTLRIRGFVLSRELIKQKKEKEGTLFLYQITITNENAIFSSDYPLILPTNLSEGSDTVIAIRTPVVELPLTCGYIYDG